jgi:hypothetical protein
VRSLKKLTFATPKELMTITDLINYYLSVYYNMFMTITGLVHVDRAIPRVQPKTGADRRIELLRPAAAAAAAVRQRHWAALQ